ncbi:MAG: hypothetical protein O7D36_07625 [Gammaproteobacteria bacterium]|nr:hypothetical protein [Gammaproteobacteria bacterium]MCZ6797803.1 hypothetical protein [Gammaproteobacteria bacterium]
MAAWSRFIKVFLRIRDHFEKGNKLKSGKAGLNGRNFEVGKLRGIDNNCLPRFEIEGADRIGLPPFSIGNEDWDVRSSEIGFSTGWSITNVPLPRVDDK